MKNKPYELGEYTIFAVNVPRESEEWVIKTNPEFTPGFDTTVILSRHMRVDTAARALYEIAQHLTAAGQDSETNKVALDRSIKKARKGSLLKQIFNLPMEVVVWLIKRLTGK